MSQCRRFDDIIPVPSYRERGIHASVFFFRSPCRRFDDIIPVPSYREWEKTLQIIQGDVLKVPLPFFDVLVANVPYNVRRLGASNRPGAHFEI